MKYLTGLTLVLTIVISAACESPTGPRVTAARMKAPLRDISAAGAHTCAVDADGRAACWGENSWAALGTGRIGRNTGSLTPVSVRSSVSFVDVETSGALRFPEYGTSVPYNSFTCSRDATGSLYCSGVNNAQQLGLLLNCVHCNITYATPVQAGLVPLTQHGIGHVFGCGLDAEGRAHCWGEVPYRATPSWSISDTLPGGHRFTAVAAGVSYACALDGEGATWCWGSSRWGATGTRPTAVNNEASAPARVEGLPPLASIDAGDGHACGVTAGGAAWCWGRNDAGQLGTGATEAVCFIGPNTYLCPTGPAGGRRVASDVAFTTISAAQMHTCALDSAGAAWCWGRNSEGQLGVDDAAGSSTPLRVATELRFTTIEAGGRHTCGIGTDGRAYCWGANAWGQLGIGTTVHTSVPTLVSGQSRS